MNRRGFLIGMGIAPVLSLILPKLVLAEPTIQLLSPEQYTLNSVGGFGRLCGLSGYGADASVSVRIGVVPSKIAVLRAMNLSPLIEFHFGRHNDFVRWQAPPGQEVIFGEGAMGLLVHVPQGVSVQVHWVDTKNRHFTQTFGEGDTAIRPLMDYSQMTPDAKGNYGLPQREWAEYEDSEWPEDD